MHYRITTHSCEHEVPDSQHSTLSGRITSKAPLFFRSSCQEFTLTSFAAAASYRTSCSWNISNKQKKLACIPFLHEQHMTLTHLHLTSAGGGCCCSSTSCSSSAAAGGWMNQRASNAIKCNQMQSNAIKCNIKCNQMQSTTLTSVGGAAVWTCGGACEWTMCISLILEMNSDAEG